jgi:cytoskeletal protein CcmA (bactofilin family)
METVVAAGSVLSGVLEAEHVMIAGAFEGEIRATGRVRITEQGRMKGNLAAGDLEIAGVFDGDLDCLRLVVAASARVEGRFIAERMCIEEGAVIQGAFNPEEEKGLTLVEAPPAADTTVETAA